MDLLSRAVTAFSPGYRAGTMIPGLKVEPSVPGHRAGTKEGPLVPVRVFLEYTFTKLDSRQKPTKQ